MFAAAGPAQGYKLTPEQLEAAITPRTKWVILNSPSNPTGAAYSKAELEALGEVFRRHPHVWIFADDMYEHIVYDDFEFATIAQVCPDLYDRTLTVNGCSKAYAMTGWRIGFAGGAAWLIKAMAKLQSQSTSNPCSIAQAAAVAALNGAAGFPEGARRRVPVAPRPGRVDAEPDRRHDLSAARRRVLRLSRIFRADRQDHAGGRSASTPTRIWSAICSTMRKVAAVQGAAFGLSPAMRISYATSEDVLREACERIQTACAALR